MGGQTALNVALALHDTGTLAKYGVELIGANERAIRMAEDRSEFAQAMERIGLNVPHGGFAKSLEDAFASWKTPGTRPSSAPRSPWAAPAAASPTTWRSSRSRCAAGWTCRRCTRC
jgi:hypothetical protein